LEEQTAIAITLSHTDNEIAALEAGLTKTRISPAIQLLINYQNKDSGQINQ